MYIPYTLKIRLASICAAEEGASAEPVINGQQRKLVWVVAALREVLDRHERDCSTISYILPNALTGDLVDCCVRKIFQRFPELYVKRDDEQLMRSGDDGLL